MSSDLWHSWRFYRDWRVLITASAVVLVDHLLRGLYWPVSVYGVSPLPSGVPLNTLVGIV